MRDFDYEIVYKDSKRMKEYEENHEEEVSVVLKTNTVVYPYTMMIELSAASFAYSTVLSICHYMSTAKMTVIFI
jgi:hypothetical protein